MRDHIILPHMIWLEIRQNLNTPQKLQGHCHFLHSVRIECKKPYIRDLYVSAYIYYLAYCDVGI